MQRSRRRRTRRRRTTFLMTALWMIMATALVPWAGSGAQMQQQMQLQLQVLLLQEVRSVGGIHKRSWLRLRRNCTWTMAGRAVGPGRQRVVAWACPWTAWLPTLTSRGRAA
jgi:hypothetical protein